MWSLYTNIIWIVMDGWVVMNGCLTINVGLSEVATTYHKSVQYIPALHKDHANL